MITAEFIHAVGQCWSSPWHAAERPEDELDEKGRIVKYGLPTKLAFLSRPELDHALEVTRRRVALAAR